MQYSYLEQSLMDWFAEHVDSQRLRARIREACAVQRTPTREGFFLTLKVPGTSLSIEDRAEADPIPGPFIHSSGLPGGAEAVLYATEDGIPETLEVFTYGAPWPDAVLGFELETP